MTTMPKAAEIERKLYVIDAAGKPLGKTAVAAADLLRGKLKTNFVPHLDCGDNVIIINAAQATLSGKKPVQKFYYRYTGWIGHLKAVNYKTLMAEKPELAMELAVKRMIPDTTIGRKAFTRLHVYRGAEHPHAAQKPETYEFTL